MERAVRNGSAGGERKVRDGGPRVEKEGLEVGVGAPMPGPDGGGRNGKVRVPDLTSGAEVGEARLGWASRRSDGQRCRGKTEVLEDGADDRGLGDVGQDAPPSAALVAGEDVYLAGSPEKLGPG